MQTAGVVLVAGGTLAWDGSRGGRRLLWVGMALAPVVVGVVGLVVERCIIRFLYGRLLDTMLATWGLSFGLIAAVTLIIGPSTEGVATPFGHVAIGGYAVSAYNLFVIAATGFLVALTWGVFNRTRFGLIARGAMQNADMVAALGIHPPTIYMMTFALGGLSVWMPTFLSRARGMTLNDANVLFGVSVLVSGFIATMIGGWLGDHLLRTRRGAYYMVSGVGMALSLPFMLLAIYHQGRLMFPAIFLALFFLLLNTGPLNAAIINAVAAPIRGTAIAINIFIIHILGDVPSPRLIGYISDKTGSLSKGFSVAVVAVAISAIVLLYGSRFALQIRQDILDRDASGVDA